MNKLNRVTETRTQLPRGRCTACGKECALGPKGGVWRHTGDYRTMSHCPGSSKPPMTPEQSHRWKQQEDERRTMEREEWLRKEKILGYNAIVEGSKFRSFDKDLLNKCPWRSQLVTFIAVNDSGPFAFTNTKTGKVAMLGSSDTILVAWPGQWRQDIFLLDNSHKSDVIDLLESS